MMKKWLNRKIVLLLCAGGLLSAELVLMLDAAVVFWGGFLPLFLPPVLWLVALPLICAVFRGNCRRILTVAVIVPLVLGLAAVSGYVCWKTVSDNVCYENPDSGKNQIYGNRKVMLIVPHQDDEINVLGGVIEEYARYGSDVYVVFMTNGDYIMPAEVRYREALAVFAHLGMPEDHAIFLGYGNEWAKDGPHIYNGEPGKVYESYARKRATYGTAGHPAYREGREYTLDNMTADLKAVILEYSPDVIFCSDYDHHIDHKATTLLFDKVMGQIVKDNPAYRPVVYKAYAYSTAWEAEPDYYADNILSTQNPFAEPYGQVPAVYHWEDRIRLPVAGDILSRSLLSAPAYETFLLHKMQGTVYQAGRVINGDRVAWQRHTTSLCLGADISVSSGRAEYLNDFMLIENHELTDKSHMPYDGVWIPQQDDKEKTATVILPEATDIFSVVLYDHPSETHNILNAVITFDDGTRMETGPLDPGGAATVLPVKKQNVSSFAVSVAEMEGEQGGLSEIEAFAAEVRADGRFVKLMDRDGNFLYDYRIAPDGCEELALYTHGDLPGVTTEQYSVNISGDSGSAVLEDGTIRVTCPPGESFVLNVTCNTAGVSDSIVVRNPGAAKRMWSDLWLGVEEAFYSRFSSGVFDDLFLHRVWDKVSYVIRHI